MQYSLHAGTDVAKFVMWECNHVKLKATDTDWKQDNLSDNLDL